MAAIDQEFLVGCENSFEHTSLERTLVSKTVSERYNKKLKVNIVSFSVTSKTTRRVKSQKCKAQVLISNGSASRALRRITHSAVPDYKLLLKRKYFSTPSLARFGNDSTDETRVAQDTAQEAHRRALDGIEKNKNTLWCYLATVLDSTRLMMIRHDCVDRKGLGECHKAWALLRERFRSNETVTVVSVMRQLARVTMKEDEALHNSFIRAQELSKRLKNPNGGTWKMRNLLSKNN